MRSFTNTAAMVMLLFSMAYVFAQEVKSTPVPGPISGMVFDVYPHPASRGALRYSLADRWDKTDLTYQFDNCPTRVSCEQAHNIVRQAFGDWGMLTPLTFTEVTSGADIQIAWAGEEQDLGGASDTLGFAYFPSEGGDIVFNDAIRWEFRTGTDNDLYLTAAHEIGHALGLDHSNDPAALMYPVLTNFTTGIADDDIRGIQALYGAPDGSAASIVGQTVSPVPPVASDAFDDEAEGMVDDITPYELWEIDAQEGETLIITVSRLDGNLRPFVGVLTADESTVLAENSGVDEASVVVTFPETGLYLILAARDGIEDGRTSGRYVLSIDDAGDGIIHDNNFGDEVSLYNFTGTDLCELYVSPSEDDQWGNDVLEGELLPDGDAIGVPVDAGLYDVLAVTCAGDELETYGLRLREGSTVEIYENTAVAYR